MLEKVRSGPGSGYGEEAEDEASELRSHRFDIEATSIEHGLFDQL
jgi:hypothetical protein